jgi:hypothetical protein
MSQPSLNRLGLRNRIVAAVLAIFLLGGVPALAADEAPLVPWPDSLRVLDVMSGERDGTGTVPIDRCGTAILIEDADAFPLLETALGALEMQRRQLRSIRRLAIAAADATLLPAERLALERRFRWRLAGFTRIAEGAVFKDLPLLTSAEEICFKSVRYKLWLPITNAYGLAIDKLSVTTLADAQSAIRATDTATYYMASIHLGMRMPVQELDRGPPNGGLREQQRILRRLRRIAIASANGTLSSVQRARLNAVFQFELRRLDDVARTARLGDLELLYRRRGSSPTNLGASPARGTVRSYFFPDTTLPGLGLGSPDVETQWNAQYSISLIDRAAETVRSHLHDIAELRRALRARPIP